MPAGLALLALLLAGCGGGSGSSTPSEATLRARLEAGVAKLAGAQTLAATETVESAVPGRPKVEPTPVGCSEAEVERGPPLRFEATGFEPKCGGGAAREAIAIGNQAWSLAEPGQWTGATLDPEVAAEVADDKTQFTRLIAAAAGITEDPGFKVAEPNGTSAKGDRYDFTAPASAFFDTARNPALKVAYAVGIDRHGYLRQIVATAVEGKTEEIIALTYGEIERPQRIVPPAPSEVSGPLIRIESRPEFEALLGPRPEEQRIE